MTIRCSVFIATSLDGFIARKDGAIDWLMRPEDAIPGEDYGYQAFFDSIDALVMGRNTYELALTFDAWPYAGKRVVVLSSGSPSIPPHLAGQVEHMSGSPAGIVQRLAKRGAQHVYVDGGDTIQRFLRAGLIHDLTLTRLPVLLGDGIPLFGTLEKDVHLQHIETKIYPNGFVQSKYKIADIRVYN